MPSQASEANIRGKTASRNNVPIRENDRNIPAFFEVNQNKEELEICAEIKQNQSSKCTQTNNDAIQVVSNNLPYRELHQLEDIDSINVYENNKRLIQCDQELMLTKQQLHNIHDKYDKLKLKFHQLHDDYHKLISIAGELTAALESSVKGQNVDLQEMLESCIQIFPDLFNQHVRNHPRPKASLQIDYDTSNTVTKSNSFNKNVSPKLLDFKKIKFHLIHGNAKTKLLLLQSLRWKITQRQPEERNEAIYEYISNDLLGLREQTAYDDRNFILLPLLIPDNVSVPHPLQQSAARLLNTFASLKCGRDYLSENSIIVKTIYRCLKNSCNSVIDHFTHDMMLSTLQKLSLRKQQRMYMIEIGLTEWLIYNLHEESYSMNSYRLEYAAALLMNLSLNIKARERASNDPTMLISTLIILLGTNRLPSSQYVNGALNNFLLNYKINEEARKMKIPSLLEYYCKHQTGESREYLTHSLETLKCDYINNTENKKAMDEDEDDDEDEVDDNEELDVLENELDENDPVQNRKEELYGETLLATCYVISSNIQHEEDTVTEDAMSSKTKDSMHSERNLEDHRTFSARVIQRKYNSKKRIENEDRRCLRSFSRQANNCSNEVSNNISKLSNSKTPSSTRPIDWSKIKSNKIKLIASKKLFPYIFHNANPNDSQVSYNKLFQQIIKSNKSCEVDTKLSAVIKNSEKYMTSKNLEKGKNNKKRGTNVHSRRSKGSKQKSAQKADDNDATICLYAYEISKENSKITMTSSIVTSESETTEMERFSSIASLNSNVDGRNNLNDDVSTTEKSEYDSEEEKVFAAKPKISRTPLKLK